MYRKRYLDLENNYIRYHKYDHRRTYKLPMLDDILLKKYIPIFSNNIENKVELYYTNVNYVSRIYQIKYLEDDVVTKGQGNSVPVIDYTDIYIHLANRNEIFEKMKKEIQSWTLHMKNDEINTSVKFLTECVHKYKSFNKYHKLNVDLSICFELIALINNDIIALITNKQKILLMRAIRSILLSSPVRRVHIKN